MSTHIAPVASSAAPTLTHAQQQAVIDQLLRKYSQGLTSGQSASALKLIAKQIRTAASAIGETVTLPQGSAASGPSAGRVTATAPGAAPAEPRRLDKTV